MTEKMTDHEILGLAVASLLMLKEKVDHLTKCQLETMHELAKLSRRVNEEKK